MSAGRPRRAARHAVCAVVLGAVGGASADPLQIATDPPTGASVSQVAVATDPEPPAEPRANWVGCGSDPMRIGSADAALMTALRQRRLGDVHVIVDCRVDRLTVRLADLEDQQALADDPTARTDRLTRRVVFTLDRLAWRLADAGRRVPALPGPAWAVHATLGVRALPDSNIVQQLLHADLGRALVDWLWLRTGLTMGFSGATPVVGGELTVVSATAILGLEARLAGKGWSTGLTLGGRGGVGFVLTRADDATLDRDTVGLWVPQDDAAAAQARTWLASTAARRGTCLGQAGPKAGEGECRGGGAAPRHGKGRALAGADRAARAEAARRRPRHVCGAAYSSAGREAAGRSGRDGA